MTELTKKSCANCDLAGCRSCKRWGWVWSDGQIPDECHMNDGVACERSNPLQLCSECPHRPKPDSDKKVGKD
jgi:hypothetical protein